MDQDQQINLQHLLKASNHLLMAQSEFEKARANLKASASKQASTSKTHSRKQTNVDLDFGLKLQRDSQFNRQD